MNHAHPVLVLGASGAIGRHLLPRLAAGGACVLAISRRPPRSTVPGTMWMQHDMERGPVAADTGVLVSVGPLEHALVQARALPRPGRIVAVGSAGIHYKLDSPDRAEKGRMELLRDAEAGLQALCAQHGITLTLLRPLLIYDGGGSAGYDRLRGLVLSSGILPVAGSGLRQPVHADDLARVIVTSLERGPAAAGTFDLGGGETLDYPSLLRRIAINSGRATRIVRVPVWILKTALALAHSIGRLRDIRPVMLERQRIDMTVDDTPARAKLDWNPRPFQP